YVRYELTGIAMAQDSGCGPEGCTRTSEEHPGCVSEDLTLSTRLSERSTAAPAFTSLRDDKETATCRGYEINPLTDFQVIAALVWHPGDVSPVTPSGIYMQIRTVLQANVNRMETRAVPLWREAESIAIRNLVRDGHESALQTARVFKFV